MSELLTAKQLAEKLQTDPETIRRWARERKIPYIRVGREYRFEYNEVIETLKQRPIYEA